MPSVLSSTDNILSTRPARVMFEALRAKRLSHSLIISSENRESVEQLAHRLAAEILTNADSPDALSRHPDFFTVRPTGKMRQISADTVRELIRSVHHSSREGGGKVAILYEADRMNTSAANIFLKTLEEPPTDTTLLLLTSRPHFLLPTIRSRCLHFRLPAGESAEQLPPPLLAWLDDYSAWLQGLAEGLETKKKISHQVMGACGLASRLTPLLKATVAENWKSQKEELPENVSEEEEQAIAEGIRVGLRDQLFAAMEHRLRAFARPHLQDPQAIKALSDSVADLEHSAGLLRVNLQEGAALESFLLAALRHWGRRKKLKN